MDFSISYLFGFILNSLMQFSNDVIACKVLWIYCNSFWLSFDNCEEEIMTLFKANYLCVKYLTIIFIRWLHFSHQNPLILTHPEQKQTKSKTAQKVCLMKIWWTPCSQIGVLPIRKRSIFWHTLGFLIDYMHHWKILQKRNLFHGA